MSIQRNMTVRSSILLTASLPLALGCTVEAVPPAEGQVRVTISTADGVVEERTDTYAEMVEPSLEGLGEFSTDGRLTSNPSEVFAGASTELALYDGQTLVLERDGNSLARVAPEFEPEIADATASAVEWSPELDTLWVTTPGGEVVVQVEGIADRDARGRYLGTMAVMLLGGHLGLGDLTLEEGRGGPVVVVALAALGVFGYVACITYGTQICGAQAIRSCGWGRVSRFKTICGAGYDVGGSFHLGYHCSFRCK